MCQPRLSLCAGVVFVMFAACSTPPGLEAGQRIPLSNQTVELLPLDGLLAQASGGAANDATAATLAARAARLRARAAAD